VTSRKGRTQAPPRTLGEPAPLLPSTVDLSSHLMPTMKAAAALVHEGGHDVVFAMELADALGCGWMDEESELRKVNDILGLNSTLPSWMLSTFRDDMRTELALGGYAMVPMHAKFMSRALPCAPRLTRLVIHHAYFGDGGVAHLANALAQPGCILEDLHLAGVHMGDEGAKALGDALRVNRKLDLLNIENNCITDRGAIALADALEHDNTTLMELKLGSNAIGSAGCAALLAVFSRSPRREAWVSVAFQVARRPVPTTPMLNVWSSADARRVVA